MQKTLMKQRKLLKDVLYLRDNEGISSCLRSYANVTYFLNEEVSFRLCLFITVLFLLRVKIEEFNFDRWIFFFHYLFEFISITKPILSAVMIWMNDFGFECKYCISCFIDIHSVWQIHRHKSNIDIGKCLHLWCCTCITRNIYSLSICTYDITVASPFGMKCLGRFWDVIHRNCFDFYPFLNCFLTILQSND